MPSAEEIKYLLQATLSSVKRFGGKRPSLSHLAQILSTKWDDEFIQIFGDNGSQRVALLLQAGSYVGDESDVAVVLKAGADRQAVLNELRSRLQDAMDKACDAQRSEPEAPSQPTEAPEEVVRTEPLAANGSEWPARTQRFVRGIIRRDDVLEREDAVDQIIGALARSRRLIPIVMGSRGSGRTSVTGRLAARLADRNGGTVWGVEPSALGPEPESPLARVIEDCESGSILVIDDFDKIAALGTANPNGMVLRVLRAAAMNPKLRLVLTCDNRYFPRLSVQAEDLVEELVPIRLAPLSDDALAHVAVQACTALEIEHGVKISTTLTKLACLPPRPADIRAHPGLAVDRLDGAASLARVLGDPEANIEHLADISASTRTLPRTDDLCAQLATHVHGQGEAVRTVASRLALTLARLDLRPGRPDGVFLFVGPTGVGKTKLALALSQCLFGSEEALIRLDMSEYSHDWAVSRLVGPMPGYVGSTEPDSWLTTRVTNTPDCVVLLDEIEKAHPVVWNTFLQVFDAGHLTDSRGVTADFSNTIIVMTSNLGAAAASGPGLGFGAADDADRAHQKIVGAVKEAMAPELINRIDELVVFKPLDIEAIEEIAEHELAEVTMRLAENGWSVHYEPEVVRHIAKSGYDPAYGARHLQRNIERSFLSLVATCGAKVVSIGVSGQQLVLR